MDGWSCEEILIWSAAITGSLDCRCQ